MTVINRWFATVMLQYHHLIARSKTSLDSLKSLAWRFWSWFCKLALFDTIINSQTVHSINHTGPLASFADAAVACTRSSGSPGAREGNAPCSLDPRVVAARRPAGRCSDPLGCTSSWWVAWPRHYHYCTRDTCALHWIWICSAEPHLPNHPPPQQVPSAERKTKHTMHFLDTCWNRTCIELQLFLFVDILWFLQAIACSDQAVTCMLCRFFCYMDIWHVTTLLEHVWDNGNMCMLLCAYMSMRIGFGWRLDLTVGIGCLRCGCRLSYYVSI